MHSRTLNISQRGGVQDVMNISPKGGVKDVIRSKNSFNEKMYHNSDGLVNQMIGRQIKITVPKKSDFLLTWYIYGYLLLTQPLYRNLV